MTDVELDQDFDINISENGDFGTVNGLEEYEQKLKLTITAFFFEHIGDKNNSNVARKLRMEARRAIENIDAIESVRSISVSNQEGDTLNMEIEYNYNQNFGFEVV